MNKDKKICEKPSNIKLCKSKSKLSISNVSKPLKPVQSVHLVKQLRPAEPLRSPKDDRKCREKPEKTAGNWAHEDTATLWVNELSSLNVLDEYNELSNIKVNNERCKLWQANMSRNRHRDYKCYDDNRVVVQMSKNDYINGTKVYLPNYPRRTYLLQLPILESNDSIEEFWRVLFNDQCSTAHFIVHPNEFKDGLGKMFSPKTGGYLYINGFFVNTRKAEKSVDKMESYVIELLPEGCSNSVMCTVYLHTYWKSLGGPEKFHAPIKAANMLSKPGIDDSPIVIASTKGSGRNAALLTLAVVMAYFNKKITPNIREIVKTIREQRPYAVDSATQYISLYLAICWLIKAKMPNHADIQTKLRVFRGKCDPCSSQMSLASEY